MTSGEKLLEEIEANKLFLKKHLKRKKAMKISYGISTMIYFLLTILLIILTIQSYNLYDISNLVVDGGESKQFTANILTQLKSALGFSIDDKFLLLGLSVFFGILFITTMSFYISLSKMNYTARPKLWLGTSIILLPLVFPFIVCVIVFTKYIKDKNWKESRKSIKKTIEPILSSVIKDFEDDVLQKEVSIKRTANEYPGFENLYESIETQGVKKEEMKMLKTEEKGKKLSRKEKKEIKKQEKENKKKPEVKVEESQITDEVETKKEEETKTE